MQIFDTLIKQFKENKLFHEKTYTRTKDEQYFLGKGKEPVRITYEEISPGFYSPKPKEVLIKNRLSDINILHGSDNLIFK